MHSTTEAEAARPIAQLAYLGIAAKDVPAWRDFAGGFLGMEVVDLDAGALALRMDERRQRMLVEPATHDGLLCLGLETVDAAAWHRVCEGLARWGATLVDSTESERRRRGVEAMRWFHDPDGHRVEISIGAQTAGDVFAPARPIGGFRTGTLGLGHVVLQTPRYAAMKELYMGPLGFRLSDFMDSPFEASFMHVNPRHHSLALIAAPQPVLHHVMVEYVYMDDVGRLYDMALREPERISVTLGRHSNDHMLSFYVKTPGGFMLEAGWAGRLIDEDAWSVERLSSPSLWGHERSWLPAPAREIARLQREALARDGIRAPTEAVPTPAFRVRNDA